MRINEVDPRNYDSDIDYYNALRAVPKRAQEPDDLPEPSRPYTDKDAEEDISQQRQRADAKFRQKRKVEYVDQEGSAPNGQKHNKLYVIDAQDEATARHEEYLFDKHEWGAKKVVDTKLEKNEDGSVKLTLYIVDNHKYGLWRPWKESPVYKESAETPESELERLKLRQNAEHGRASLQRQSETQARIRELEKQIKDKHGVAEGMLDNPGQEDSPVAQAIIRRILMQRTDLLAKYGPERVGQAVDNVADFVGDTDEIGSSDVSGWVRQVERELDSQGVAEGSGDPEIRPGMKTQYGIVVSVKGNTVTVRASNGELTNLNIHDIQQVAEDAEPMDREFALVKKLGRLGQRIVQNPKLWRKYSEAVDNDNIDWIIGLIQDGTGATSTEVNKLSNLFGEIGGGLGRIIDFAWAVKEGTWEDDFMDPYRQHRSKGVAEAEETNPTDVICVDVPLFIRLMEYAREDASTDMDLHDVAERLIRLSAEGATVTMSSYDEIVGSQKEIKEEGMSELEQGRKNIISILKASEQGQDAQITVGGEPITLEYPEARYVGGRYKAFLKAGRQEEFLRALTDARAFDRIMSKMRAVIDKQRNFRGSVPGQRGVEEAKDNPQPMAQITQQANESKMLAQSMALKENEYYCQLDKKVKLIPEGYKKNKDGFLVRK